MALVWFAIHTLWFSLQTEGHLPTAGAQPAAAAGALGLILQTAHIQALAGLWSVTNAYNWVETSKAE